MARGHQKFQSQQKNAKKQADIKKSKGHDQKAAAKAALVYTCTVCRVCAMTQQNTLYAPMVSLKWYCYGESWSATKVDCKSTTNNGSNNHYIVMSCNKIPTKMRISVLLHCSGILSFIISPKWKKRSLGGA